MISTFKSLFVTSKILFNKVSNKTSKRFINVDSYIKSNNEFLKPPNTKIPKKIWKSNEIKNMCCKFPFFSLFSVEDIMTQLGYRRITDKNDYSFKLRWVECKAAVNYSAFRDGKETSTVERFTTFIKWTPSWQLIIKKTFIL